MMFTFKQINKISWNEPKYKQSLNKEELQVFKGLNRKQKEVAVWEWLENRPFNLLNPNHIEEINHILEHESLTVAQENKEKEYEKLQKFFNTQGIHNPSDTTLEAFKKQQIFANFDNFYHAIGQFTLNMEKQATYNYYMSQQKQNFVQIAQLDTLIKQHNDLLNQNHKVMQQNDEIIELLRRIVEK